jgi:arsenate reductase
MDDHYNILFLCTGNSARSILGEVLATTLSHGRFVGYSAGSRPAGFIHPLAMQMARDLGYPLEILRSKSWDEFGINGAPQMDFIITVCDSAADEECPYWPGHPATAHWGFPDPAKVIGSDEQVRDAFRQVEIGLRNRIELLMDLSIDQLDQLRMGAELERIHRRASVLGKT